MIKHIKNTIRKYTRIETSPNAFLLTVFCAMILYWLLFLRRTSANYFVYLIIGMASLLAGLQSLYQHKTGIQKSTESKLERNTLLALACALAVMVALANYALFLPMQGIVRLWSALLFVVAGSSVFLALLKALYRLYREGGGQRTASRTERTEPTYSAKKVFGTSFIIILLSSLSHFFLVANPAYLTPDSLYQIQQLQTGVYTNHHPFYHTQLIKLFYDLGYHLTGNVNQAIAFYTVFQNILFAAIFAYVITTIYQVTNSCNKTLLALLLYALVPYFRVYTNTVWKDVVFAAAVTVFITSLLRARSQIGSPLPNHLLLLLSSIAFCVWRSNGLIAFMLIFLIYAILFFRSNKKIIVTLALSLLVSLLLLFPILQYLGVKPVDRIESLSIPAQQIARVIYDDKTLSEEDLAYLNQIIDTSQIKTTYKTWLSDPIKTLVRQRGGNEVINEDPARALNLWLRLGLQYPGEYIKAWVDQTVGYWNAGYIYWVFPNGISENTQGFTRAHNFPFLEDLAKAAHRQFQSNEILALPASIGLMFWIYLSLAVFSLLARRKSYLECLPLLAITLTLLIATPVYSEFRYAYVQFTAAPLLLLTANHSRE